MRIIFFGSDNFAVVHLEALIGSCHQVLSCVTQPDKRKGRHLDISVSPVKDFALKRGISVWQPSILTNGNFISQLKNTQSDLFIVVAYGKILPEEILSLPKIFCMNIHGSLLPKYRGAAPINWAIINGEKSTGVTAIKMNPAMDAGEIISSKTLAIQSSDNSITLRAKMAKLGASLLEETLDTIEKKSFTLTKQDERLVTLAPKLTKEHGLIRWEKSAVDISRLVRGLLPWPTAYTHYGGKLLKILEANAVAIDTGKFSCGQVIDISKGCFTVATGQGGLQISCVHPESSKPMDAKSFVAGHKLGIGFKFQE